MITFLPVENFDESTRILDYKRLGKQRVEGYQILIALIESHKWDNHPAYKMWKGYEPALAVYTLAACAEWVSRGYTDNLVEKIVSRFEIGSAAFINYQTYRLKVFEPFFQMPPWMGMPKLHDSHKSRLLQKDPVFYGKYGWDVQRDLPYYWPV